MQIYIGEEDNWTPASTCQAIVSRINASGGRAHIEIYPGAYHTFDGKGPLTLWPDAYSWVECGFRISDTTKKVYDPANPNVDFSNLESRIEAYKSCAKKGEVMAGSSPKYNRAAYRHLAEILPSLR